MVPVLNITSVTFITQNISAVVVIQRTLIRCYLEAFFKVGGLCGLQKYHCTLFCQSSTPTVIQTNSTIQPFLYPAVTTVIGSVEIKHT